MAKTKKRSLYLMVVRKIILFQDGDNGRKLSALYEPKNDEGSPHFLIQNFCNDSNTRKEFFSCVLMASTVAVKEL